MFSIALITFGPVAAAHAESKIEALMGSAGVAVSDQDLDQMRGGFIDAKGLLIRFSVTKTTKINGDVTRQTSLVVDNTKKAVQTTTVAVATPAVVVPVTTPASATSSAPKASTPSATMPVSQTLPTVTTSIATSLPAVAATVSVATAPLAASPSITGAVVAMDGLSNTGAPTPDTAPVAPAIDLAAAPPTDVPSLVSMTAGAAADLVQTADLPTIAPPSVEIATVPQTPSVDPVVSPVLVPDIDVPVTPAVAPEMIGSTDVAILPIADTTVLPPTIETHLAPDAPVNQAATIVPEISAAILPTTPQSSTPTEPSPSSSSDVEQPLVPITSIAVANTPSPQAAQVSIIDPSQSPADGTTATVLAPTTEFQTVEEEIPLDADVLRRMLFTPSVVVNDKSNTVVQEFTQVTVDIGNFSIVSSDMLKERLAASVAEQINTQVMFSLMHN